MLDATNRTLTMHQRENPSTAKSRQRPRGPHSFARWLALVSATHVNDAPELGLRDLNAEGFELVAQGRNLS
jgi:hypothetical protein